MSKYLVSLVLLLVAGPILAAQNSLKTKITRVDLREGGAHAVYLADGIPNEACTHNDRAIIVTATQGASGTLNTALSALTTGKQVVLRVDGCTPLVIESTATATIDATLTLLSDVHDRFSIFR